MRIPHTTNELRAAADADPSTPQHVTDPAATGATVFARKVSDLEVRETCGSTSRIRIDSPRAVAVATELLKLAVQDWAGLEDVDGAAIDFDARLVWPVVGLGVPVPLLVAVLQASALPAWVGDVANIERGALARRRRREELRDAAAAAGEAQAPR